jgi:hypothetical protein
MDKCGLKYAALSIFNYPFSIISVILQPLGTFAKRIKETNALVKYPERVGLTPRIKDLN